MDGWQERSEHPWAQLTVPPASLILLFSGPRPSLTTPGYKGVLPRRDGPPRPQGDLPATDPWGCSYNRQHRGWLRGPRAPFGGAGTELAAQAAGGARCRRLPRRLTPPTAGRGASPCLPPSRPSPPPGSPPEAAAA